MTAAITTNTNSVARVYTVIQDGAATGYAILRYEDPALPIIARPTLVVRSTPNAAGTIVRVRGVSRVPIWDSVNRKVEKVQQSSFDHQIFTDSTNEGVGSDHSGQSFDAIYAYLGLTANRSAMVKYGRVA
nr:MAG: hypothetical protein [Guiyang fiers-like virus 1]